MKTITALILAATLAACGGQMPIDEPPDEPMVMSCVTKAVRSNAGSFEQHSTDGGKTWKLGACGT